MLSRPIVLASASPRRRQLLQQMGLEFTVVASCLVESTPSDWTPPQVVTHLALAKARCVAQTHPQAVVIGADTVVVVDGYILGKPAGPGEAASMLRQLRGREHQVYTGVAVVDTSARRELCGAEMTRVCMRPYGDEEIRQYVATGEPADKAGAYAIQGKGALLVEGITGCYSNVVGLPLARLGQLLEQCDIPLW